MLLKRIGPEWKGAFEAGAANNTSWQMLGEFMSQAMSGQEIKAPTTPGFFYNCLRPAGADPKIRALMAYTAHPMP